MAGSFSAPVEHILAEYLQSHGCELCQRAIADVQLDAVIDVTLVGLMAGWPNLDLCYILKPLVRPCAYGVFSGFCEVNLPGFRQCALQLFFDFCLSFAQNILKNLVSGDCVMTCGEPVLPTAVTIPGIFISKKRK